nr:unnamed protein product [Callosobruchus chinensis]
MARKGFPVHRQNMILSVKKSPSATLGLLFLEREGIYSWYEEVSTFLKVQYEAILKDPVRGLSEDEAGFLLCPKPVYDVWKMLLIAVSKN